MKNNFNKIKICKKQNNNIIKNIKSKLKTMKMILYIINNKINIINKK